MTDAISVVTGTKTLAVSEDPVLMSDEVSEVSVAVVDGSRVEDSIMVCVDSVAVPREPMVEESVFVAEGSEDEDPVVDEPMVVIEEPLDTLVSIVASGNSVVEVGVVVLSKPLTVKLSS